MEKGYNFYTELPRDLTDEFKQNLFLIIHANMPGLHHARQMHDIRDRVLILAFEPPHILPINHHPEFIQYFKKNFIWDKNKVDNKKFFKMYFFDKQVNMIEDVVPFHEKKLCTFINSDRHSSHPNELYSQRKKAIEFFEKYHPEDFEFYGMYWPANMYKTYRGTVDDKTEAFKQYKFAICYENITNIKGYVTEKIFHCFFAGCVPVYWGATDIAEYIPADCFIDKRNFSNLEELYNFMKHMSEEKYNQYLKNIRAFYASPESKNYSFDTFISTLMNAFFAPDRANVALNYA